LAAPEKGKKEREKKKKKKKGKRIQFRFPTRKTLKYLLEIFNSNFWSLITSILYTYHSPSMAAMNCTNPPGHFTRGLRLGGKELHKQETAGHGK